MHQNTSFKEEGGFFRSGFDLKQEGVGFLSFKNKNVSKVSSASPALKISFMFSLIQFQLRHSP